MAHSVGCMSYTFERENIVNSSNSAMIYNTPFNIFSEGKKLNSLPEIKNYDYKIRTDGIK
jgi:hypothetical protein